MQTEMHGSRQALRKQIQRSLLIEEVLKSDVEDKAAVSLGRGQSLLRQEPGTLRATRVIQLTKHFHPASAKRQLPARK